MYINVSSIVCKSIFNDFVFLCVQAYHKITEERKKYITELHEVLEYTFDKNIKCTLPSEVEVKGHMFCVHLQANAVIDDTKTKRRQALNDAQRQSDVQLGRISNPTLQK